MVSEIDSGYAYVAVPSSKTTTQYITSVNEALTPFLTQSNAPTVQEKRGRNLMLNTIVDLDQVGRL